MPVIGWIFIVLAAAMIIGSLMLLRDSANTMNISDEKMAKIKKRQAELEAEERRDD